MISSFAIVASFSALTSAYQQRPIREAPAPISRRSCLALFPIIPTTLITSSARAATDVQTYEDPKFGVKFEVPASWVRTDSTLGSDAQGGGGASRRIILFVDPKDNNNNAFIAYTPVRGDYTSLSSFGTIDYVSHTIVPEGPGIESELLDSVSKPNSYYFDYKVKPEPTEPMRRLKTAFSLAHSGTADMLVAFTAQTTQETYDTSPAMADVLSSSVKSFSVK